jgi:3D (Asp-Asp-Asp) domain-containing protein
MPYISDSPVPSTVLTATLVIVVALCLIPFCQSSPEGKALDSPASGDASLCWKDVDITVYHATPEEGWGDGCTTYDGTDVCPYNWDPPICALSPDLLKEIPLGSKIYLTTLDGFWAGSCEVRDRTSSRFRNRVDILVPKGVGGNFYPDSVLMYSPYSG